MRFYFNLTPTLVFFGSDFGTARGALLRRCSRWESGRISLRDRHPFVAPRVSPEALLRVPRVDTPLAPWRKYPSRLTQLGGRGRAFAAPCASRLEVSPWPFPSATA